VGFRCADTASNPVGVLSSGRDVVNNHALTKQRSKARNGEARAQNTYGHYQEDDCAGHQEPQYPLGTAASAIAAQVLLAGDDGLGLFMGLQPYESDS